MSETEKRDLVLTTEMKTILKGSMGFNVKDPFVYVPKAYRTKDDKGEFKIPKELWPKFTLISKDGVEAAEAEDNAGYMTYDTDQKQSKMFLQSGKARVDNLRTGILKVENLPCEDGSTMSFDKESKMMVITSRDGKQKKQPGVDTKAIIRMLTTDLQLELANAINERKTLTEEELRGLGY